MLWTERMKLEERSGRRRLAARRNPPSESGGIPVLRGSIYPRLLGVVALSGGAALVTYLILGVSLDLGLAFALGLVVLVVAATWWQASGRERTWVARTAGAGALAGLLATVAYDAAKFGLSHLEASTYDPFAVLRTFGVVIAGPATPVGAAYAIGTVYHTLNGITFGVAFAFLMGRRGLLAGVVWGLFLETFQLTLFPGWLNVQAFQEFAQVSALSHLVYGAVLGLLGQRWLRERPSTRWSRLNVTRAS